MKKILVFGSSGMIGHAIFNHLTATKLYKVIGSANHGTSIDSYYLIDVRDQVQVEKYLTEINPDIVINCAGVLIIESENNIEDAILINSLFPNLLSRLGNKLNYKLIQISTDCVFSGKDSNYSEIANPDGESVYARTKALGEKISKKDLVVRTSTIGYELKSKGHGLLQWFLQQKGEINGFTNAIWTGVTTLELAKGVDAFIKQEITGLYNFVPKEKISKYDLLLLIKKVWNKKNVLITPKDTYKTDKSLINNRTDFYFPFKSYKEMLYELKEWISENQSLYPDYL
jgi:dTDP-4-dehydrorhamnose reductase